MLVPGTGDDPVTSCFSDTLQHFCLCRYYTSGSPKPQIVHQIRRDSEGVAEAHSTSKTTTGYLGLGRDITDYGSLPLAHVSPMVRSVAGLSVTLGAPKDSLGNRQDSWYYKLEVINDAPS
jgi:hypothetical protein